MFFIGAGADEVTDDHEGYVAGRCRDGSHSDIWTDVSGCAPGSFIGFVPACECGWSGVDQPYSASGYRACQRAWIAEHFAPTVAPEHRSAPDSRMAASFSDSDFDWGTDLTTADLTTAGQADARARRPS